MMLARIHPFDSFMNQGVDILLRPANTIHQFELISNDCTSIICRGLFAQVLQIMEHLGYLLVDITEGPGGESVGQN